MVRKNRRRFFRNLALILLLALTLWGLVGFPLPTAELSFRQAERRRLADRSTIVWTYREKAEPHRTHILVGVADDAVYTYERYSRKMSLWPRRDGGTPVVLPDNVRHRQEGRDYFDFAILVPDPPEGAAYACLLLTVDRNLNGEDSSYTYAMESWVKDGTFLFQPLREHPLTEDSTAADHALWEREDDRIWANGHRLRALASFDGSLARYPYTLEFFDAGGELVTAVTNPGP